MGEKFPEKGKKKKEKSSNTLQWKKKNKNQVCKYKPVNNEDAMCYTKDQIQGLHYYNYSAIYVGVWSAAKGRVTKIKKSNYVC